jgi:hypothetical protein
VVFKHIFTKKCIYTFVGSTGKFTVHLDISTPVVSQGGWWVWNVDWSVKLEALTEREVLSALEHLRIEIQVHSNKR